MDTLPIFPYIMRVNLVLVLVGAWVIPAPSCSSRSVYDLYISNSFRVLFSSLSNKKGSPLLVPSPRDLSLVSTLLPSPPSSHSSTPSPVYGIIDALHGFPEHCHRQKQCLRDICRIWIRLPRKVATSSVRNFHSMNSWPGIFFIDIAKMWVVNGTHCQRVPRTNQQSPLVRQDVGRTVQSPITIFFPKIWK